jgi:hypothetical protein
VINRRSVFVGAIFSQVGLPALASAAGQFEHPGLSRALELFNQAQWQELIANLANEPPQSALELVTDLGEIGPPTPAQPNLDALAGTKGGAGVAGAIMMGWAWKSRGDDFRIKDEEEFGRRLEVAKSYLDAALSEDPGDGIALTSYVKLAKANGDRETLTALLPMFLQAERKPVGGLTAFANAMTKRWGGSDEALFEFCRRHSSAMAPASYGLIPDAHTDVALQKWQTDIFSGNNPVFGMSRFLRKKDVLDEIMDARQRFLSAPEDPDPYAMRLAHAQFSLAFRSIGDNELLKHHIEKQGLYINGTWRAIWPRFAKGEIRYLVRRFARK